MSDDDDEGHDPTAMLRRAQAKRRTADMMVKDIIERQIPDIPSDRKLQPKDILRICKNIDRSVFDRKRCCMWRGHVTNMNNLNKGRYVNFYFRRKKVALHRLLYVNFVGELNDDEYLKFNCDNKGICCNIHHLKKFKYQKIPNKQEQETKRSSTKRSSTKRSSAKVVVISFANRRDSDSDDDEWDRRKNKLTLRLD